MTREEELKQKIVGIIGKNSGIHYNGYNIIRLNGEVGSDRWFTVEDSTGKNFVKEDTADGVISFYITRNRL